MNLTQSIALLAATLTASAAATTTEERQYYLQKMDLVTFITPSEEASYYWQNMSEVLPTSVIARQGLIKPLERDLKSTIASTQYQGTSLNSMLTGEDAPLEALMVIKEGKITFEHFNINRNQKHVWMSNAKTLAGLMVAQLEQDELIDVQKPLSQYLPQVKGTAWQNIKVIDVLNQQSGLDIEENDITRYNPRHYVSQFFQSEIYGDDYLTNLLKPPAVKSPGEAFEYSSLNTQMLALLISTVTGQRLSEVLQQRIWAPAGMTSDAILALSPTGHEIIHGLISSNLEDMMRYGMLYTPSWHETAKTPVVTPQILNKIRGSITSGTFSQGDSYYRFKAITGEEPLGSSYQWDQIWADGDMYKSGMRGQGIYVSPDKDLVIGWFSKRDAKINAAAFARQYAKQLTL
ncbi:beta-lactamase family protein [Vibrio sp. SCSIO 43135]|uniref:Beta-lactamase family protein n=1 Tax=Vibrio paucivorans TaxID=2829489 RepID=A0A9X3CH16_9VIBR|nr:MULTISPECIES: serine hydrolase domain-containing protein [Vibrio]MCW8335550.1 beta-lactamase family protein [Vibrio paucivorans]USD43624.1 beta-lactamase family protein [Vibrio sp. SCSIO 43135]